MKKLEETRRSIGCISVELDRADFLELKLTDKAKVSMVERDYTNLQDPNWQKILQLWKPPGTCRTHKTILPPFQNR